MIPAEIATERTLEPALVPSVFEHTLLGEKITEDQIIQHCEEAKALGVFGVCVPLAFVPLAKKCVSESSLKVITVVDFPLGQKSPREKVQEARIAQALGADEIDLVMDYQALLNGDYQRVLDGIAQVVQATAPLPIKVILETSALDNVHIAMGSMLVQLGRAAFAKTSTGFHTGGANVPDIELMRQILDPSVGIKASGGIRTKEQATAMLTAGASRIGSSQTRAILFPSTT